MTTKTGRITCALCGKFVKQANHIAAFVCPDPKCANSEERYYE